MFSRILTIFNITHVVIPCFGFEGWIKILIATVPDIYIIFEMPRRQRSANAVKAQCERRDSTVHARRAPWKRSERVLRAHRIANKNSVGTR